MCCIQPGMVLVPTASLLQRHLLHHQDSFRIQGITLRLSWSHLLLVWGWGISGARCPLSPSKFQQIHCVTNFFQQIPFANGGFNGKYIIWENIWGKSSIYRANEVSPPGRRRESRLQLLFTGFVGEHGQNQPQSPGPWQGTHGDPCHRRCPFTCPRKSCRLGKIVNTKQIISGPTRRNIRGSNESIVTPTVKQASALRSRIPRSQPGVVISRLLTPGKDLRHEASSEHIPWQ